MKKMLFVCFILLLSVQIFPQWVQTNGPTGGFIGLLSSSGGQNAIAVSYSDIYNTSGAVLYISTDKGLTWKDLSSNQPDSTITAAALSDSNIFLGSAKGLFLSSDKGLTWKDISKGINTGFFGLMEITAIKASGSRILVGTYNKVFQSTDMGSTWKDISSGISSGDMVNPSIAFSKFLIKGNNVFAISGYYFGAGVYRLQDTTWSKAANGMTDSTFVFSIIALGDTLYAGTSQGIFISVNNGDQWKPFGKGLPQSDYVTSLAATDSTIIAGTLMGGIFRSSDKGNNWSQAVVDSQITFLEINALETAGNNILAATDQGIYLSGNNAAGWKKSNTGIVSTQVTSLTANGSTVFCAGNGIFRSTDNGTSWQEANKGLKSTGYGYPEVTRFLVKDSTIFAAALTQGILVSSDNGVNWAQSNSGLSMNPDSTIDVTSLAANGNMIFAGTYTEGVFLSTDNGKSWKAVSNGLPKLMASYEPVYSLFASGSNVLAGTNFQQHSTVFISTDNGSSWKEITGLLKGRFIADFATVDTHLFAGGEGGLYSSADAGLSWTKTGAFQSDTAGVMSDVTAIGVLDSNIFVSVDMMQMSGMTSSMYRSSDLGNTWKDVHTGLPADAEITSFAATKDFVFAGTLGRGVWKLPVTVLAKGIAQTSALSPARFMLEQNYPNPFNPVTTIRYSVPVDSKIKLVIYNLLGEEIRTLIDEAVKAGEYNVIFKAGGLPSGVYFYTLDARSISGNRNFRSTKKFILLK